MVVMGQAGTPLDEMSMVIESANDAEIQEAVTATLAAAGVSLEELRRQATESRFVSEHARRAWFVVSPFLASH